MLHAFIEGIFLTVGLILPLGMQNIFIFNQGATQRHFFHTLPSILTAFSCDAFLILSSVLGVSLIVLALPWLKSLILIIGIIFLLYMGCLSWNSELRPASEIQPLSPRYQIIFALSASLLNPHALIDTIGVIGINSLHFAGQDKWAFTVACLLVSFSWFIILALAGYCLKTWDESGRATLVVNKVSALMMWGIALYLLKGLSLVL